MSTLRVSAVQLELRAEPTFGTFATHVTEIIEAAASGGAELVVLPELCTTGLLASHPHAASLTVADVSSAYREVFPPFTDALIDLLHDLAVHNGVTVLGGSHLRLAEDGSHRNTAHLAHPDGRIERQDKLHLTPQEQDHGILRPS